MAKVLEAHTGACERIDGPLAGLIAARMQRQALGRGSCRRMVGMGAYRRLPDSVRAMIDGMLADAACHYGCTRNDLVWTLGIYDGKPVLHVDRRESYELLVMSYEL